VRKLFSAIFFPALFLALAISPASASKADDTLHIAVVDWWSTLDP
jgi:hypothetical protein